MKPEMFDSTVVFFFSVLFLSFALPKLRGRMGVATLSF